MSKRNDNRSRDPEPQEDRYDEKQFLIACKEFNSSPDFINTVIDVGDKQPFYLATGLLSNRQQRQKRLLTWLKIHPFLIHFLEDYLEQEYAKNYVPLTEENYLSIIATYPPYSLMQMFRLMPMRSTPDFINFFRGGGVKTRLLERMVRLIGDCPFILETHRLCLTNEKRTKQNQKLIEIKKFRQVSETVTDTSHWYEKAVHFFKNECLENAILCFTVAINADEKLSNTEINKYHRAYYWRGHTYFKLGLYEEAIWDFDKIISLNPDDKYIYNDRGRAYEKLDKLTAAKADYSQAFQLNPHLTKTPFIKITEMAKQVFREVNLCENESGVPYQ